MNKEQGYEVNAWFRHDWKPLTSRYERGLKLLTWSRADLVESVHGLSRETRDAGTLANGGASPTS
jgi:hypothetical protein